MLVVYAMSGLYVFMILKVINMCINFDESVDWRRNYYKNEQKQMSLEVVKKGVKDYEFSYRSNCWSDC